VRADLHQRFRAIVAKARRQEDRARAEARARIRSPRRQSAEEKRRVHTQLVESVFRDLRR